MKSILITLLGVLTIAGISSCYSSGYVEEAPPTAQVETRPDQPAPEAVWVDGYWRWQGGQYVWVPGYWETRPFGAWVSGYWDRRTEGYYWVPGHWEKREKFYNRDERRRQYHQNR